MRTQKGITLVALVITIIVLLILAGVSIASVTGNDGMLTRAETAVNTSKEGEVEEKIKLGHQEYFLAKHDGTTLDKAAITEIFTDALGTSGTPVVNDDLTTVTVTATVGDTTKTFTLTLATGAIAEN